MSYLFLLIFIVAMIFVVSMFWNDPLELASFKKHQILEPSRLIFFPGLIVLIAGFLLVGCCTPPPPIIIEKVKIVRQTIPESHLLECVPPALIDKKSFMAMELNEREEGLTLYSLGTLASLSNCNKQIQKIRELNDDYQPKNQ